MKKIFCKIGVHKWGEMIKKPLKMTGPNILFFTWSEQEGYKVCKRCGKKKWYRRSGLCGNGVPEPIWKRDRFHGE